MNIRNHMEVNLPDFHICFVLLQFYYVSTRSFDYGEYAFAQDVYSTAELARHDYIFQPMFNCASSDLAAGSLKPRILSKTQPLLPSFRAVPQNSQAPLVPPDSGAPQLGQ